MRFFVSFVILFVFWIILSGKTDMFHIVLGVISTTIVALWSSDLLVTDEKISISKRIVQFFRFKWYIVWLSYQIVLSNLHVLYVCLHPKMNDIIEPQMVEFTTNLKGDLAKFMLATSITLTPGTTTVRIDGDKFLIHALTNQTAAGVPGEMESRIGAIFA